MRRECVAANFRSGPAEERQRQIAFRWWKGHILHDAGWWGTCANLDPVPGVDSQRRPTAAQRPMMYRQWRHGANAGYALPMVPSIIDVLGLQVTRSSVLPWKDAKSPHRSVPESRRFLFPRVSLNILGSLPVSIIMSFVRV